MTRPTNGIRASETLSRAVPHSFKLQAESVTLSLQHHAVMLVGNLSTYMCIYMQPLQQWGRSLRLT